MERLNYGGRYYDDDDEQYQAEAVPWYRRADPDYDPEEEDREGLEAFEEEPELVAHQLEHATQDIVQAGFAAQFRWRSKARRGRRGRFVPPDMKPYRWPTFVRVADLQNPDRV